VNRSITGAIVRRQPFGGWKRSSVGAGAKAGGPNYLIHLGAWRNEPGVPSTGLSLSELDPHIATLLTAATSELHWEDFDVVRRGAISDHTAWTTFFTAPQDVSELGVERNIFRYVPIPVVIRLSEGASLRDLVRMLLAGILVQAPLFVSSSLPLPAPLHALVKNYDVDIFVEDDEAWIKRAASAGEGTARMRLIGGDASQLAEVLGGNPDVTIYSGEVTQAGRIELLPFLREQAVSITNHRFGNPSLLSTDII